LYGLGGAVALVVLAIVAFIAVGTFWPEVIEGAPPTIAAGIDFSDERAADAAFDARLRRRFPPGTAEAVMRAELQTEGFAPEGGPRSWSYTWGMFPFGKWLNATWSVDTHARITEATGSYSYRCV